MSARRYAVGAVGLLVLMWLGVACGGSSGEASGSRSPSVASPANGGAYGSGGSGSGGAVGGTPKQVQVQQGVGGLVFTPSELSVKRGTQILVADPGSFQHTFTIRGTNIDVVNDPGQFQTVAITLPPGAYTFVCRFHEAQGMTGTLTVTP